MRIILRYKKVILTMFLVLTIVGITLFTFFRRNITAVEKLNEYGEGVEYLEVKDILFEEELGNNKLLIIYRNMKDTFSIVLLEKKFYGFEILRHCGEIQDGGAIPVGLTYSYYNKGKSWIGHGVFNDNSVHKMTVDDKIVKIVDVEGIKVWYLTGNHKIDTEATIIYDVDGNILFDEKTIE